MVFSKETRANENVYQLFSICFQRQILKADHAKRNHAHREEILSVLWKILTTILTAKPSPRYSCFTPWCLFGRIFSFFLFFSLSFLSCVLGAVFNSRSDFGIHSSVFLLPILPWVVKSEWGRGVQAFGLVNRKISYLPVWPVG